LFTKPNCKTHNNLQLPNIPSHSKRKGKGKKKRIANNDNTPKEKEKVRAVSSQRIFCFTLAMHRTANLLNLANI